MRKPKRGFVAAALVLGALCVGAAPSHAEGWHRGGWGRGPRVAVNVGVGPYGYGYGPPRAAWRGWGRPAYYRPYAYYGGYYGGGYYGGPYGGYGAYYAAPPPVLYAPQPVVIQPAPIYIERPVVEDATDEATGPSGPAYWYYCSSARQYYPKVSTCREPWVKVLAEDR